jgi:glutathione peroxidase
MFVGDDQHPLYAALTEQMPTAEGNEGFREWLRSHGLSPTEDPDVLWNFEKFLIDGAAGSSPGSGPP